MAPFDKIHAQMELFVQVRRATQSWVLSDIPFLTNQTKSTERNEGDRRLIVSLQVSSLKFYH